jgi:hypothetical protein
MRLRNREEAQTTRMRNEKRTMTTEPADIKKKKKNYSVTESLD